MRNVFYVLFTSLFWPDYQVRKGANDIVRKCVVDKGNTFCVAFLDLLFPYVTSGLAQEVKLQFLKLRVFLIELYIHSITRK